MGGRGLDVGQCKLKGRPRYTVLLVTCFSGQTVAISDGEVKIRRGKENKTKRRETREGREDYDNEA
jgi:hypothetical protein